eukprot:86159-Pelagomonas_calceolata.AAC.4
MHSVIKDTHLKPGFQDFYHCAPLMGRGRHRVTSIYFYGLRKSAHLLNKEFRTSTTVLHTWTRPTLSHVMILDSTGLFAYEQNRMGSFCDEGSSSTPMGLSIVTPGL